jgi:hypothetical protein
LDVKLGTDCWDYHILEQCAKDIKGVEGLVCEVGTREGGSLQIIINALLDNSDTGRHVISVDPYGNIPYYGENGITRFDYTNDMKKRALKNLYAISENKDFNLVTLTLTDAQFFNRFADGVPVYDREERIIDKYAMVFLDADHSVEAVRNQVAFFLPRLCDGGFIIVDDVDWFVGNQEFDDIFVGMSLAYSAPKKKAYKKPPTD